MTYTSVDSVIESFPHSTFPKIEGEPDFASIKNIEKLIITNASSCESELGGGQHGISDLSSHQYVITRSQVTSSFPITIPELYRHFQPILPNPK